MSFTDVFAAGSPHVSMIVEVIASSILDRCAEIVASVFVRYLPPAVPNSFSLYAEIGRASCRERVCLYV